MVNPKLPHVEYQLWETTMSMPITSDARATAAAISLPIEGMTCAACSTRLEKVLNRLPGVEAAVNLAAERARIRYVLELAGQRVQVLANNDAADNTKDQSAGSALWKAIKASDGSLVVPGTAGTLKYDAAAAVTGNGDRKSVV